MSVGQFCKQDYTATQIAAMTATVVNGRYNALIADTTYFVLVEAAAESQRILACGGWTPHRIVYSSQPGSGSTIAIDESFNVDADPAWIRGVYVHPDFARKGLCSFVVAECERVAQREKGFRKCRLAATLNAVRFYERCGYVSTEEKIVGLPDGLTMKVVMMEKVLHSVE